MNELLIFATSLIFEIMLYEIIKHGICSRCGKWHISTLKIETGTQYSIFDNNFMILCPECSKEIQLIVQGMWDEYYSSQGYGYTSNDKDLKDIFKNG